MMEPTCTHKQQNIDKKEIKRGSFTWWWCPPTPKNNKTKRKKGELAYVESWQWHPPNSKPKPKINKTKNKNKNKIGCLPLNSCFQTLHSSSSKLSTLQALSSLNPNVQPTNDGVIARGVWGGWVNKMREVDGLVRGRVVGFRV
jgi:hypothetical protein